MPIKTIRINSGAKHAILIAAAIICVAAAYFAAKWSFAHTAAIRADLPEVAAFTVELAPDDPQTHYAAGVLFEETFVSEDLERSLLEFERAAAASPNNYLLWLALGRARERSGDQAGAESALRQALSLAPNYSRVQWALGNALLRQGRTDEGFAEIRRAVAGDPAFTNPAAAAAWQIFGGDLVQVRNAIGDSPQLNLSLALLLAGQKRFDEAFEVWKTASGAETEGATEVNKLLYQQFVDGRKFRFASLVAAKSIRESGIDYRIGQVTDGGFETGLKKNNSSIFEWQISDGPAPLIGQTDGQKRGGNFALLVSFGSGTKEFRQITQTIAVEPGKNYELEMLYKADLKSSAMFHWEIADAVEKKPLSSSGGLSNITDWTPIRLMFTVPSSVDGIVIQLVRQDCDARNCVVSGNFWFDDLRLVAR